MSSRSGIYYWKCDRASAFHGTLLRPEERNNEEVMETAARVLAQCWTQRAVALRPAGGQGNHLTYLADVGGQSYFVRIEDGPEQDDYLEVESELLRQLRRHDVPVPQVHFSDATRRDAPFAIQVLQLVSEPDLNTHFKAGTLNELQIAREIGATIAHYQNAIQVTNFGPFDIREARPGKGFVGLLSSAAEYFLLNLQAHLNYLVERQFLRPDEAVEVLAIVDAVVGLLDEEPPCLVHKDMALWNVMGTTDHVTAFIDWDDAIAGDAMDDLSLLACFHSPSFVAAAFEGYASRRPLPKNSMTRFWMHLLRNMIVKAVIRVGAGYFERSDNLFLLQPGQDGEAFRLATYCRLRSAMAALTEERQELAYD